MTAAKPSLEFDIPDMQTQKITVVDLWSIQNAIDSAKIKPVLRQAVRFRIYRDKYFLNAYLTYISNFSKKFVKKLNEKY